METKKTKGVRWAQILTLMADIAGTLEATFAKKSDLETYQNPRFDGDVLVFPSQNAAHFEEDALVLTQ